MKESFEELYDKVKTALLLEIKYKYIDFDGRRTNFSGFMKKTLKEILNRIHKTEKPSISRLLELFNNYNLDDLQSRRTTIDLTIEVFARLKKIIKPQQTKKETKEYTEEIDELDVDFIKGVGPQLARIFNKMGIFKVKDLLEYYPRKYVDYKARVPISALKFSQSVTIIGTIERVYHRITKNGLTILTVTIRDNTGSIDIYFFLKTKNRRLIEHYKNLYPVGSLCMALGKVKFDNFTSQTTLEQAQIQILGSSSDINNSKDNIVPIYPLSENLSSKVLINAINNAFEKFYDKIYDPMPSEILKKFDFIEKKQAMIDLPHPKSNEEIEIARKRLVFEELFSFQLNLALLRLQHSKENTISLSVKENGLVRKFINSLPYELTNAQKRAIDEIFKDLNSNVPMQRLLQGDVGSGKTVVACIMLLLAIENGYQGAIMAPTEILAIQHFKNFTSWLTPLGLSVGLYVGKNSAKVRKELYSGLQNGQINVAVGTHALIQDEVKFYNLGAVVVDEQHRFGVKQRNALLNKGKMPQMLNMTATPIPRTLALTLHGDLDITVIDELPKGRKPIITTSGGAGERKKAYELIKKEIFFKHQAYIVYPLIDESETISAKAATLEAQKLQNGEFKDYRVGLLHGKMDNKEKDDVMNDFVKGKYDILVSTTVVEVGVDNPNATVIIIEDAHRFGLSQLHQLRGRVGRSDCQSYCVLISNNGGANKRLDVMTKTNDGFVISQKDLELRGPGEFLGTRQSGLPDFNLADIVHDVEILELARCEANEFVKNHNIDDYPLLKNQIEGYKLFRG